MTNNADARLSLVLLIADLQVAIDSATHPVAMWFSTRQPVQSTISAPWTRPERYLPRWRTASPNSDAKTDND